MFYDHMENNFRRYSFNFLETCLLLLMYFGKFTLIREKAIPAGAYLFKFNSGTTITMRQMCSKLIIKASDWRNDGVFLQK